MDYVFISILLICGLIDYRTRIMPNKITIPLVGICLLYQAFQGKIALALVGLSIGFGIGLIFYCAKGIGGGDVKIMAAIGAYFGAFPLVSVLFIASVLSIVWGLSQILKNKISITSDKSVNSLELTIPFGTCLSIAMVNIYFYPITF